LLNNRIIELAIGRFHSEDSAIRKTKNGIRNQAKQRSAYGGNCVSVPVAEVAGSGLPKLHSKQKRLIYLTFPGLDLAGESLLAKGGDW
jgi:hypothetical protein